MNSTPKSRQPEDIETGEKPPSPVVIKETLRRILESQPFRTSKQCQDLLRYLVLHSLSGDDAPLKERIIGSGVFGRAPSYDTNEDPVVRVRAADVRKRLAQYYQSFESNTSALHIELLPGSYRTRFRYGRPVNELPASAAVETSEPLRTIETPTPVSNHGNRRNYFRVGLTFVLVLIAIAGFGAKRWIQFFRPSPLERFWGPITDARQPALIYIGANAVYILGPDFLAGYRAEHHLQNTGLEFYPDLTPHSSISVDDLIPQRDTFVSVADLAATAQITTLLSDWKKPFKLRAGRDLSFGDLRNQPSVMIGAFNNPWTLELTDDLPYRFRDGLRIVSRDHPDRAWSVPKNARGSSDEDYALITRVLTSKTGGPAITVSGIGQSGTQAAAELLTSPDKTAHLLQNAPRGWESKNMQIVLHVKVVGYLPVSEDVVAITFW